MSGFGRISINNSPSRMFVCPNCDNYGCGDYIVNDECPFCHYPLFSNDYIYMPNFNDAYDLAVWRAIKNKRKKMGFDEDDSGSTV